MYLHGYMPSSSSLISILITCRYCLDRATRDVQTLDSEVPYSAYSVVYPGGALGPRTLLSALTHTLVDSYIAQPQHLLTYSNLQVLC